VSIYVPYPGLPLTEKINLIDTNLSHYYQGVFVDMPPKPVYETENLSAEIVMSKYKELLRRITQCFNRRVDSGENLQNKFVQGKIDVEELVLGADALAIVGDIDEESKRGKRQSVFNIVQGMKKGKKAYVSKVINEDDRFVVGFAEVYTVSEMKQIVKAIDGSIDIIQLDIDQKEKISQSIVQAGMDAVEKSKVYTYSDFETLFKSVLYIMQNECGQNPYQNELCIFPLNNSSIRLSEYLSHLGYQVRFYDEAEKNMENTQHKCFHDINKLKDYSTIISFCLEKPLIDENLINHLGRGSLVIDASLGSITENIIPQFKNKDIILRRPDIRSLILSELYLAEHYEKQTHNSRGKKMLGKCTLVSGGVVGEEGDIVVDNVNNIRRVFGVADGVGKIKGHNDLTGQDKFNLGQLIRQVENNTQ